MALSGGLFTLQPGCLRETTGTAASCTASVAALTLVPTRRKPRFNAKLHTKHRVIS